MNVIKLILGIGTIWLAGFSNSAQAYLIDWNRPYPGSNLQGFSLGKTGWTSLVPYQNDLEWNRAIQMWQAVQVEKQSAVRWLRGISFQLTNARGKGTIDLNVYEGTGVSGRLVSSTKLQWASDYGQSWYAFKLTTPVLLNGNSTYTFSFENMMEGPGGGSLSFAVAEGGMPASPRNTAFDGPFLQYRFASRYLLGLPEEYPWPHGRGIPLGLRGYYAYAGTVGCRINYFFLD